MKTDVEQKVAAILRSRDELITEYLQHHRSLGRGQRRTDCSRCEACVRGTKCEPEVKTEVERKVSVC